MLEYIFCACFGVMALAYPVEFLSEALDDLTLLLEVYERPICGIYAFLSFGVPSLKVLELPPSAFLKC